MPRGTRGRFARFGTLRLRRIRWESPPLRAGEAPSKLARVWWGEVHARGIAKADTESAREHIMFQRDNYTCIFCGRSALTDKAILHVHHCYSWSGQHGNRLDELGTTCERGHTHANHQEGGKLWGYDKKMQAFSGAAFMNSVRWDIYNRLKELPGVQVHMTYGAATKRSRLDLGLEKSHVNDAYAMSKFHPEIRAEFEHYEKRRRNNRVLERFYDAKHIDVRDGQKKSGADLSCGRTKRNIPSNNPGNQRIYRGNKMSKGRRAIRKKR